MKDVKFCVNCHWCSYRRPWFLWVIPLRGKYDELNYRCIFPTFYDFERAKNIVHGQITEQRKWKDGVPPTCSLKRTGGTGACGPEAKYFDPIRSGNCTIKKA